MHSRFALLLACVTFATLLSTTAFAAEGTLRASVILTNNGGIVPAGAKGVRVLSLNLTRDCAGIVPQLRKLTLIDEDTGDLTDISGVSISVNGARITKEYFIDPKSHTVTISLPSTFVIEPCSTVRLDIDVSISTSAKGSTHVFSVEFATDILLDSFPGDVIGDFPLKGIDISIIAPIISSEPTLNQCSQIALSKLSPRDRMHQRKKCRSQLRKDSKNLHKQ